MLNFLYTIYSMELHPILKTYTFVTSVAMIWKFLYNWTYRTHNPKYEAETIPFIYKVYFGFHHNIPFHKFGSIKLYWQFTLLKIFSIACSPRESYVWSGEMDINSMWQSEHIYIHNAHILPNWQKKNFQTECMEMVYCINCYNVSVAAYVFCFKDNIP